MFFNGDNARAKVEARAIMEKLDFNNNGTIDYSEFQIAQLDVNKIIQHDNLLEVFNLFDLDHSGTITVDEIKKILGGGSADAIDEAEWERILMEVDEDGNGEISFDEFTHMIYRLFSLKPENHGDDNHTKEEQKLGTLKKTES